jgi:hypothetical protein
MIISKYVFKLQYFIGIVCYKQKNHPLESKILTGGKKESSNEAKVK